MLQMKKSVLSFEENTTLVCLLSNCRQVLTYFKTNPLDTIFEDFSIWLQDYRTEFSCLYVPQGHNLISTVWLWSTDEYASFLILSESPSLNNTGPPGCHCSYAIRAVY